MQANSSVLDLVFFFNSVQVVRTNLDNLTAISHILMSNYNLFSFTGESEELLMISSGSRTECDFTATPKLRWITTHDVFHTWD